MGTQSKRNASTPNPENWKPYLSRPAVSIEFVRQIARNLEAAEKNTTPRQAKKIIAACEAPAAPVVRRNAIYQPPARPQNRLLAGFNRALARIRGLMKGGQA